LCFTSVGSGKFEGEGEGKATSLIGLPDIALFHYGFCCLCLGIRLNFPNLLIARYREPMHFFSLCLRVVPVLMFFFKKAALKGINTNENADCGDK